MARKRKSDSSLELGLRNVTEYYTATGVLMVAYDCEACGGIGMPSIDCQKCHGTGVYSRAKNASAALV